MIAPLNSRLSPRDPGRPAHLCGRRVLLPWRAEALRLVRRHGTRRRHGGTDEQVRRRRRHRVGVRRLPRARAAATRLVAFIASGEMAVAYWWMHVGGKRQDLLVGEPRRDWSCSSASSGWSSRRGARVRSAWIAGWNRGSAQPSRSAPGPSTVRSPRRGARSLRRLLRRYQTPAPLSLRGWKDSKRVADGPCAFASPGNNVSVAMQIPARIAKEIGMAHRTSPRDSHVTRGKPPHPSRRCRSSSRCFPPRGLPPRPLLSLRKCPTSPSRRSPRMPRPAPFRSLSGSSGSSRPRTRLSPCTPAGPVSRGFAPARPLSPSSGRSSTRPSSRPSWKT